MCPRGSGGHKFKKRGLKCVYGLCHQKKAWCKFCRDMHMRERPIVRTQFLMEGQEAAEDAFVFLNILAAREECVDWFTCRQNGLWQFVIGEGCVAFRADKLRRS